MINTSSAFWQTKMIGGVINNFAAIFPLCAFAHNGEKRIQDMGLRGKIILIKRKVVRNCALGDDRNR